VKFLIDQQLPRSLGRALFHLGFTVIHVSEVGLKEATDAEVWRYALTAGCVLITKDSDFCHLARRPGDKGRVVWVRIGNCPATVLTDFVTSRWIDVVSRLDSGDRIIEIQ
jgi:predicted nuclease of predicted toxin-antitoxin system